MNYRDSKNLLDTPQKILKVNHAGEFGAVNIYRAQIMIGNLLGSSYVPLLESFLEDETRHLEDEQNHRGLGKREGGTKWLYAPLRFCISIFTEATIRFGMR